MGDFSLPPTHTVPSSVSAFSSTYLVLQEATGVSTSLQQWDFLNPALQENFGFQVKSIHDHHFPEITV